MGQRILIGVDTQPSEVVGIVADTLPTLEAGPRPAVFRPFDQAPIPNAALLVRTSGDPHRAINAVRDQVQAIDRDQPIAGVQTMEDLIETEGGQRRVIVILLGAFSGAALLLALFGMYSVIAYSVAQRTQELGIRRALGAQDTDILRMVVSQGLALTCAGIAVGIGGALALTRFLTGLLFHTSPIDPVAYTGATLLFIVVASAASYIPARYAARVDPMTAIRN